MALTPEKIAQLDKMAGIDAESTSGLTPEKISKLDEMFGYKPISREQAVAQMNMRDENPHFEKLKDTLAGTAEGIAKDFTTTFMPEGTPLSPETVSMVTGIPSAALYGMGPQAVKGLQKDIYTPLGVASLASMMIGTGAGPSIGKAAEMVERSLGKVGNILGAPAKAVGKYRAMGKELQGIQKEFGLGGPAEQVSKLLETSVNTAKEELPKIIAKAGKGDIKVARKAVPQLEKNMFQGYEQAIDEIGQILSKNDEPISITRQNIADNIFSKALNSISDDVAQADNMANTVRKLGYNVSKFSTPDGVPVYEVAHPISEGIADIREVFSLKNVFGKKDFVPRRAFTEALGDFFSTLPSSAGEKFKAMQSEYGVIKDTLKQLKPFTRPTYDVKAEQAAKSFFKKYADEIALGEGDNARQQLFNLVKEGTGEGLGVYKGTGVTLGEATKEATLKGKGSIDKMVKAMTKAEQIKLEREAMRKKAIAIGSIIGVGGTLAGGKKLIGLFGEK